MKSVYITNTKKSVPRCRGAPSGRGEVSPIFKNFLFLAQQFTKICKNFYDIFKTIFKKRRWCTKICKNMKNLHPKYYFSHLLEIGLLFFQATPISLVYMSFLSKRTTNIIPLIRVYLSKQQNFFLTEINLLSL